MLATVLDRFPASSEAWRAGAAHIGIDRIAAPSTVICPGRLPILCTSPA